MSRAITYKNIHPEIPYLSQLHERREWKRRERIRPGEREVGANGEATPKLKQGKKVLQKMMTAHIPLRWMIVSCHDCLYLQK